MKLQKRWQKILALVIGILFIIIPGIIIYHIATRPQPVGVDDDVVITDESVSNREHSQSVQLADGSMKDSHEQKYLTQIYVEPPVEEDSREFMGGAAFFNNLVKLLESGSPEDINQGAALYEKNREQYQFTTPENLLTAAIGNDLILIDEYQHTVEGVSDAGRGVFDKELGEKILRHFNSPITLALVGSRLLPVAHESFVIDYDSHVMDQFLYEPSWYEGMIQFYPGDNLSLSRQPKKLQEMMSRYSGRLLSAYEIHLTGKFSPDVDVLLFEDGDGKLFVYGFYYTDPGHKKQTLGEYLDSDYSTFDNFQPEDLNWNNFVDGFNEIYNQTR